MSCISSQIYISQISWILMSDDRLKYKYSNCCLLANYIQQMVKDAIKSSPSLIYVLLSIRIFVQLSSKNFFQLQISIILENRKGYFSRLLGRFFNIVVTPKIKKGQIGQEFVIFEISVGLKQYFGMTPKIC